MTKILRCSSETLALDLSGKTFIITGSNSGIGFVVAQQVVRQGAHVIMACRREDAANTKAQIIMAESPKGTVEVMQLDLGDLSSVRVFAKKYLEKYPRLDALVNNAGVMNTPQGVTKDGFETQFGVNHLGHFLLTSLLLDRLKASAPSRIICLSSCFHDKAMGKTGEIIFEDLHFKTRKYNGWKAYAQSKLANLLHAKELARRLDGTGVIAVSAHPGWVRTELARHSGPVWVTNVLLKPILSLMGMMDPWEGAQSTLHCLLNKDVVHHSGAYYSQTGVYRDKASNAGGWPLHSPNPEAHRPDLPQRLWRVSEEAVGLSPTNE